MYITAFLVLLSRLNNTVVHRGHLFPKLSYNTTVLKCCVVTRFDYWGKGGRCEPQYISDFCMPVSLKHDGLTGQTTGQTEWRATGHPPTHASLPPHACLGGWPVDQDKTTGRQKQVKIFYSFFKHVTAYSIYSVSQKKSPPCGFWNFSQTDGNFLINFYTPITRSFLH